MFRLDFSFLIRFLLSGFLLAFMLFLSDSLVRKTLFRMSNNSEDELKRELEASYFYMNTIFYQTVLIFVFITTIEVLLISENDPTQPFMAGIATVAIRGLECLIVEMASEVNYQSQKGVFSYRKYTSKFTFDHQQMPAWFVMPISRFMKKQLWISVAIWIACRIGIGLLFNLIG